MKQNSLQKWISNDNVGRAVAVLNKPWFHSEDEQVCAAQTISLIVSDVPLAQEVLFMTDNSFKEIPLSEITCMREGERISTDVNFYKIKNWFVAPKDTIVGARIAISGCAYAAFLPIDNNYESTLADSSLTGVESCQPFIIPKECLGKDVNKLLGRKVQVDEIQDKTVRELQSYGVFIN